MNILLIIFLAVGKLFAKSMENPACLEKNDVCSICSCNEPLVNCEARAIDNNVLPAYEWPNWTEISLNMDNNVIRHVSEFPELRLINLSLAHNLISEFSVGAFKNLSRLQELDLSDNYLMPGSLSAEVFKGYYDSEYFWPLKTLRILNLSHNQLDFVIEDLFLHLPFLEYLDLSYNPLRSIDDATSKALTSIPFLKVLNLSYTGISNLPEYFLHNCAYLKVLNLEGNEFTEMPKLFMQDKNLTRVEMDGNPIVRVVKLNSFKQ